MSLGGGASESSGSSQGQSGFRDLPAKLQLPFLEYADQLSPYVQTAGGISQLNSMFKPLGQTAGETQALNTINNNDVMGNLQSNINAQMNPYQSSVIDQVNRNAYGQNSQLQSQLNSAGQFGSNRAALGANDIANSQASTIGGLLSTQYNTALQNALTTIPQANLQNAQAQLQGGQFERSLNAQQNQAPLTGLQTIAQLLGVLPTNSSQNSAQNSASSWNFNAGVSDRRVKHNIVAIGDENGFPIYEFSYIGSDKRYIGVMAQDVEKVRPDAVFSINGTKAVNYDAIGVQMREA